MANRIEHSDLIQHGNPFAELIKYIEDLKTELAKLKDTARATAKDLQVDLSNNGLKTGNDLSLFNKQKEQTKKVTQELTAIQKEENKLKIELDKINTKLSISEDKLTKDVIRQKIELNEINKATKTDIQLKNAESNSIEKLRLSTNKLSKERDKLDRSSKEGKNRFNELTNEIRKNNEELLRLDKQVKKSQRNVGNYPNIIGKAVLAFGALMAAFRGLSSTANIFINFQKNLSGLRAIIQGTPEQMKMLSKQARELGATSKFTASEILQLDTELAKLGFTALEISDAVPGVQALAAATGIELAEAAKTAGATLRIFNLDASESTRVADVLAVSTTKSALDMSKLSTALPIVGTTAKIAGQSLEETVAQLGILSDRGVDASTSATGLRNIFLQLSKKGLTWNEAQKMIIESTDKNATAMKLFGVRSSTTAIILAENGNKVNNLTSELKNLTLTADDMAKIMQNNVAGSITKLSSAWTEFVLSIESGEGILSRFLRTSIDSITLLLNLLSSETGIDKIIKDEAMKEAKDNFKEIEESYKDLSKVTEKELNEGQKQWNKFIKQNNKEIQEQEEILKSAKDEIKELEEKTNDYIESLGLFSTATNILSSANNILNKEEKERLETLKAQETNQKQFIERKKIEIQLAEKYSKIISNEITFRKESNAELEKSIKNTNNSNTTKEEEKTSYEQVIKPLGIYISNIKSVKLDTEKLSEDINQKRKKILENGNENIKEYSEYIIDSVKTTDNIINSIYNNRKKREEESFELSVKALEDQLNKNIITQTQYEKKLEQLEETKAKKNAEIDKKIAKERQAIAIIEAIIQTALGVVEAKGNIAKIALITALGLSNIAIIKSQKFAEGGEVGGKKHIDGGTHIEAEKGEYVIRAKSYDKSKEITKAINDGRITDADLNNYMTAKMQLKRNVYMPTAFMRDGSYIGSKIDSHINETRKTNNLLEKFRFISNDGTVVVDLNGNIKVNFAKNKMKN